MRYGSANTEAVDVGVTAGVAGLDVDGPGVGGRTESVADRAGDGGIMTPCGTGWVGTLGEGATIGEGNERGVGSLTEDDDAVDISGL